MIRLVGVALLMFSVGTLPKSPSSWPVSELTKTLSLRDRCQLVEAVFADDAPTCVANYLADSCAAKAYYLGRAIVNPTMASTPDDLEHYLFSSREKCEGRGFRVLDARDAHDPEHRRAEIEMWIEVVGKDNLSLVIGVGPLFDDQHPKGEDGTMCLGVPARAVRRHGHWKIVERTESER